MKKFVLATLFFILPAIASAQSIDILYAGDTYTPPFYQGGALWSGESSLKLFAVPQGLGSSASLSYKWRRGTLILGSQSGVGDNSLSFTDDIFSKPQTFSVQIVDPDDNPLAQALITVAPTPPDLLIYEKHPLYGFLFNKEITDSYPMRDAEATLATFPLFFSTSNRGAGVTYEWKSLTGTDSTESEVTYRAPEEASGSAGVSVVVANPSTLRQKVEASFLIQFGNEK